MIARSEQSSCSNLIARVDRTGASSTGWRDAVWHAIAPFLAPDRRVVRLDVLHRAKVWGNGTPQYHVTVRLAFTQKPEEVEDQIQPAPTVVLARGD